MNPVHTHPELGPVTGDDTPLRQPPGQLVGPSDDGHRVRGLRGLGLHQLMPHQVRVALGGRQGRAPAVRRQVSNSEGKRGGSRPVGRVY